MFPFKRKFVYELGERLSSGVRNSSSSLDSSFYEIKGKRRLGVKLFYNEENFFEADQNGIDSLLGIHLNQFRKELEIGKYLNQCKVPTPKYVGVCDIKIPEGIIMNGLVMEKLEDSRIYKILISPEIRNFEEPFTIDEIDLSKKAKKTAQPNLETVLTAIIESLNLLLKNSKYTKRQLALTDFDLQGLYSPKDDTFYFIDFGSWLELKND